MLYFVILCAEKLMIEIPEHDVNDVFIAYLTIFEPVAAHVTSKFDPEYPSLQVSVHFWSFATPAQLPIPPLSGGLGVAQINTAQTCTIHRTRQMIKINNYIKIFFNSGNDTQQAQKVFKVDPFFGKKAMTNL